MNLAKLIDQEISSIPNPSKQADEIINENCDSADDGIHGSDDGVSSDVSGSSITDSSGAMFDSTLHATDGTGKPKLTITGKFRKKSGRKKNILGDPNPQNAGYAQAGKATAETIFALGQMLGGDEWAPIIDKPTGVNEREHMIAAWAEYYKATGKTEIPPGVIVCVAMASYSLPRLAMPKTQTKIERLVKWVGSKMNKKKKKDNK